MLTHLKIRDFRCFPAWEGEFSPGVNAIVGPNAHGKTSLLEAVCVLLRLQSPRTAALGPVVRIGGIGFVVDGFYGDRHLQFYYSQKRKKLALDSVVQRNAGGYLEVAKVVWFSNADYVLASGAAEERRRYLDFVLTQSDPAYRQHLRAYEKALRSRNYLLKNPKTPWREIAAFDTPLLAAGVELTRAREQVIAQLAPLAAAAHHAISGAAAEPLSLAYHAGAGEDFAANLAASRAESLRLRQTLVGPHRDDLGLLLHDRPLHYASEGQQRTVALALRLAHAQLLTRQTGTPPLLLLDDIFGELDPQRRNALMNALPPHAQQIFTTTHLDWMEKRPDRLFDLSR